MTAKVLPKEGTTIMKPLPAYSEKEAFQQLTLMGKSLKRQLRTASEAVAEDIEKNRTSAERINRLHTLSAGVIAFSDITNVKASEKTSHGRVKVDPRTRLETIYVRAVDTRQKSGNPAAPNHSDWAARAHASDVASDVLTVISYALSDQESEVVA